MIASDRKLTVRPLVRTTILLVYLSGYAAIRKDCQTIVPNFVVVPHYLASSAMLRTIYRPCFLLEGRSAGKQFSITPWGMISP